MPLVPPDHPDHHLDHPTAWAGGGPRAADTTQYLPQVRPRLARPERLMHSGADVRPAGVPFPAEQGETQLDLVNRILDEQQRQGAVLAAEHTNTVERLFRRRRTPRVPLTVKDLAAVRLARTERMAQHRDRHERHMNLLEAVRAYLGIACLIGVFLLVVGMGIVAFGVLVGWYTWAPVH